MTKRMGGGLPPKAVVVGVGDELLYGHTVNTNGAWLGGRLSDLGLHVAMQFVVGDRRKEIQAAVDLGLGAGEVVIVTGGLGPTPDDLTRPAVADHLGFPLQEDPGLVEDLRRRVRVRGYDDIPPNNRQMAQVPSGALVLSNPVGAAPGLAFPLPERGMVILLPGIPAEMRGIFTGAVAPLLERTFGARLLPVHHRFIHATGIPESVLAREVDLILPGDSRSVSVAYLPDLRGVRLRLTTQNVGAGEAESQFDAVEARLEGLLRPYRYRAESGDLAEALGEALMVRRATVAVAESCTGGLISKRITDLPGSSRYYLGGVVAYSDAAKALHLGVSEAILREEGAVSQPVAEALALGVSERFGATAGLGVTGVAGPGGGAEDKPVGTVWYAASVDGVVFSRKERFLGDREAVRERAAQAAMALLLACLEGRWP